ncbi:hypothetical protein [Telluribacter humicola]|uniref:hypothetical protein n=1 Tax=Telluribacter humicola TaxID=1720261 RepID=UPI001A96D48D|nr:hypothetical protein [Telluribacter humicola]
MDSKNIQDYPLSTFMIIGYSLTQYYIPILFTLLELNPLIFNLNYPIEVFIHSLASLLTLVVTHIIYRNNFFIQSILKRGLQTSLVSTNLFSPPRNLEVWIIGMIGMTSMFYLYFVAGVHENKENVSTSSQFIRGFVGLSYAPFILPLKRLYSKVHESEQVPYKMLGLYALILLAISIGTNSRGAFMYGFTSIGLAYFMGLLLGKYSPNKLFSYKNLLICVLSFWLITGPLADLGTAMVVVRGLRTDVSSSELLAKTLEVYQNKEELKTYKKVAKVNMDAWDEEYFSNIYLARFSNLKFNDLSLEQAIKLGSADERMRDYSLNRILAILPQPLLTVLQVEIDKNDLISISFGDYLYYLAGGGTAALGGFRTGQFSGTGMASFGWWYLLYLAGGIFIVYFLIDLLAIKGINTDETFISLAGLISVTSLFSFLSVSTASEHVVNLYTFAMRGWIELVFLYLLVIHFTFLVSTYLLRGRYTYN